MKTADFIVIGAGIAGASAAYELSKHGSVIVLEMEKIAGYHTTGRSAAISSLNFISYPIEMLTAKSREYLANPPSCFGEVPLTSLRRSLWVTQHHQINAHQLMWQEKLERNYEVEQLSAEQVAQYCPALKHEKIWGGLLELGTLDLDVHGILHGYLRGLKENRGEVIYEAPVMAMKRSGSLWQIVAGNQEYSTPVVVNAAGAWADEVAKRASLDPIRIRPLRRTVFTFEAPKDAAPNSWPFVYDTEEKFYVKLENGIILASAFDEIESPPCDARPEEYDIALGIDNILQVLNLDIRSLKNKWAGLRTFAPDREMVIGEDNAENSFYWLAGQGGIGIMTAPGAAMTIASLITERKIPDFLSVCGVSAEQLSPKRFFAPTKARALA